MEEAWPSRGVVPAFWPDVRGNPLRGGPGPALGGPPREVWEAGLPPDLVWYVGSSCLVLGRLLGHAVGDLVSDHSLVRRGV